MQDSVQELIKVTKRLKLLYVEDDKDTRFATLELLKSFFDKIEVACDGMQADELYKSQKFDIVFTDISMPNMDGIELIENIRQNDSNIPVVVLSAYNDNDYLMQAIKLGVDGYIVKPLELDNFLNILKKVVRKYQLEEREKESSLLYERIGESIKFASVIQHSLIPTDEEFAQNYLDHFSIWQPRDLVGGDFYFFTPLGNGKSIIVLVDCTGHGVHGAFLTMLCEVIYRQIIARYKNRSSSKLSPAKILMQFNTALIDVLHKDARVPLEGKGFDGQVLYIDKNAKKIHFAGAKNPLFYTDGNTVKQIKGDNRPVGYNIEKGFKFSQTVVDIHEDMKLYIATDGFWEQMGGPKQIPFGKKRFMKMLQQHCQEPMSKQKQIYLETLKRYQDDGDMVRVDDLAFIGIDLRS